MKNIQDLFVKVISCFFMLLFIYAATSKILDFENFQVQISQSPLLSAYAGIISYIVIAIELIIVLLLIFPKWKLKGLYASTALMTAFTIYIYLILNYSDFVPCSCGGILEKLGWTEHLIFNLISVILGFSAVLIAEKRNNSPLKKVTAILFTSNFLSIILVSILFLSSEYIMKKQNNFTRRFLLHPVLEKNSLTLDNKDYYFAGLEKNVIYLGNRKYPLSLTTTDTVLSKAVTHYIQLSNNKLNFKNISTKVNGPDFYIYDGTIPIIFKGRVGTNKATTISFQDAYFNSLIVLDSLRFAIRTQSATTQNVILGQLGLNRSNKLTLYPGILKKQIDGVFDLDGRLIKDYKENELIYVYAYRNQFIVMDDKMSVKSRLHTIDTIKKARIKSIELSDGSHKMIQPPLRVNSNSYAYNGLLFNHSVLMGKHESKSAWKKADVIDVYKTNTQQYIGSFYIYRKNGRKLKELYIKGNSLYVIQDNLLTKYNISGQITKYFRKGEAENPKQE